MPAPPSIPFPSTTPTHPLLILSYPLLAETFPPETAAQRTESDRLFEACTTLGFFYLDQTGLEFGQLGDVGERMFEELKEEDKALWDVGVSGNSFGYKRIGHDNVNENGDVDTNEQFNISRDDLVSYPLKTHMEYPRQVIESIDALRAFTDKAREVSLTILKHLERHLELAPGTLQDLHREGPGFTSPTKARVIRNPPQEKSTTLALGAHTDFGTLTLLDNNLTGGLQVLAPGKDEWEFVKPIAGHTIVNLADALSLLSGGILRSNLHRVLPPPGAQRACTRWSSIWFFVPEYNTVLSPLVEESVLVKKAVEAREQGKVVPGEGSTCRQWFHRRVFGVRAGNRTGPQSWLGSRGTEYVVVEGLSAKAAAAGAAGTTTTIPRHGSDVELLRAEGEQSISQEGRGPVRV